MTARHSTLFTLRSGQSGLGIYTTRRDAAPRGLRQIDQRPPRHREGVWLDQKVVWSVPVQTARHRKGECCVWSVRDRLLPDPAGQSAQAGDGGGFMNRQLYRDVARRQR